jgi:hypothetical protein
VTLIQGLELQHAQHSIVRRGHIDIETIHVILTDARVTGRNGMGL